MTLPRPIIPGVTYLVTRRCAQREFLLRPSPEVNGLFLYLIAEGASRFGILVHAFCVLSNHFHLVATDPHATLPKFMQHVDSLVARALNPILGRSEGFWASNPSYSAVTLTSPPDVLEKAVYTLANPVAAGLVPSGREWPGLWSDPEKLGNGPITVPRPGFFFREKGPMPKTVELELAVPPGFESIAAFRKALIDQLATHEQSIAATMKAEGRPFAGARRVLAQKPTDRPTSKKAAGGLHPMVAGRDKWKRIEALRRLTEFRDAYRAAWAEFRKGVRDVVFPYGTYWLRVTQGVRCAAPA